jgi:hypothetical protein
MLKRIIASAMCASIGAALALAEEPATEKPPCLRAKSIIGWAHGNEQIARLDTAGKRWRVTFREPCLNKRDKPLGLRFGVRVGRYCVEPGDQLVFVTIGGYEQYCTVAKIEQMKLGEKLVPDQTTGQ